MTWHLTHSCGAGASITTRPRPQALPTSRRLDPATHLVASIPALAQSRLETAACDQALRRVRACAVDRFNSFSCIPALLSLRESCLREMCTGSLGGGRGLARKHASSDPTMGASPLNVFPDWATFVCAQALPRNWMILRRSRFDGRAAGNSSNCRMALRSAATFWRNSRLASVSR